MRTKIRNKNIVERNIKKTFGKRALNVTGGNKSFCATGDVFK